MHRLPFIDTPDIIRSADVHACTARAYCLCMRRQSTITIDAAVFDRYAIKHGLTRRTGSGQTVVSNSAIARRLGVAQSTVSRARAGLPVDGALVVEASLQLKIPLVHLVVREPVAA